MTFEAKIECDICGKQIVTSKYEANSSRKIFIDLKANGFKLVTEDTNQYLQKYDVNFEGFICSSCWEVIKAIVEEIKEESKNKIKEAVLSYFETYIKLQKTKELLLNPVPFENYEIQTKHNGK